MASKQEPFSIDATNDPNYQGYTKDIAPAPVNHAWGTLFEGLGKLAAEGVKAADSIIEEKAKSATRKEVDNLNAPYTDLTSEEARVAGQASLKNPDTTGSVGGGTAGDTTTPETDNPGGADDTVGGSANPSIFSQPVPQGPPSRAQFEIDTTYGNLQKLMMGRQAGTVTPDYYYTQLVAAQKRLRSQFPGYEDTIDQKLHQLTGVIPANAQIHALWSTFKAQEAGSNSAANRWENFYTSNAKDLGPDGVAEAMRARGNQAWQDAIKVRWAGVVQARKVIEDGIMQANLDEKGRSADLHTQEARLSTIGSTVMGKVLLQSEASLAARTGGKITNYADAISGLAKLNNGKGPTPEDLVAVQTDLATLKASYIRAFNEAASAPGFASVSSGTKNGLLEQQLKYIDTIQNNLQQGGFQVAGIIANKLKWTKDSTAVGMIEDNNWVRNIAGMENVNSKMLETVMANIGNMDTGIKNPDGSSVTVQQTFVKTLMKEHTLKAVTGTGTLADFSNSKNPETGQRPKPEYILKHIDNVKQILNSPEATPQMKANAAAYLSGPGAEDFVKPGSLQQKERLKAAALFADPKTTDTIFGNYGPDAPQWRSYKDFAVNNLMAGVQANIGELRQQLNNPELKPVFDPAEGIFKYNSQGTQDTVRTRGRQTFGAPPDIRDNRIQELNTALRAVKNIYDKEGNATELPKIIKSLGLEPQPERNDLPAALGAVPTPTPGEGSLTPSKMNLQRSEGQGGGLQVQPEGAGGVLKSVMDYAKAAQKPMDEPTEGRLWANKAKIGPEWGNPFAPNFSEHLTQIATASGKTVNVNKVAAQAFQGLINDLEARGYEIKTLGGMDMRANKSNPSMLSQHALGNAIDINAKTNAYGQSTHDMPKDIGAIAKKWHLSWGGEWNSVKDPMHFEYSGPVQKAASK